MTERARQVLNDCHVVLQMLEEERDLQRWRIHWAAAVALIRAVGHVLYKVDGANDQYVRQAASAAFKRWQSDAPEHEIFREFFDRERNNILKEYQFNLHPLEEVSVSVRYTLQPTEGGDPIDLHGVFPIGDNIYRPLLDSYREGDDARDVYSEAIQWWESQLTAIENSRSPRL